ncbi:MAG: hypothetical protein SOZ80_06150 [Prevotella sp.]|uniref:hypothetical protein n=1 Tax=Prevotella sp. TaxID=59823 RepID=UPI002A2D5DE6|nr:hypothetical protein [Prevotella sp.]MDD7318537.1 hypothetical protein [Prevotellaceae bacterium]MDY4020338.1 hypothetical protein [Prevotella sp.]
MFYETEKANYKHGGHGGGARLDCCDKEYCNSYPNGYPDLLDYAQDIFDRMTDMPKE